MALIQGAHHHHEEAKKEIVRSSLMNQAPRYPHLPLPDLAEKYATARQIAANPFWRAGFRALEGAIIFKCDTDAKLRRLNPRDRLSLELMGEGFTKREIAELTGVSERELGRALFRFYADGCQPIGYKAADKLIAKDDAATRSINKLRKAQTPSNA